MTDREVVDLNVALNDLTIDNSNSLEMRVLLNVKAGNFQAALEEALALISTRPESSKGYLLTGMIYSAQGQGQVAQTIYDKALETVDLLDEQYDDIVSARNGTCETWQQDGVLQLPAEIICSVIELLPIETKLECTQVCKQWRETLFSNPPIWYEMDGHLVDPTDLLEITIPKVTRWVRQLSLGLYSNQCSFATLVVPLLQAGKFRSVESLSIQFSTNIQLDRIFTILRQVLRQLKNTLVKLDLTIRAKLDTPTLGQEPTNWMAPPVYILAECPRLMHLKYFTNIWFLFLLPEIGHVYHHLTSLHLCDSTTMVGTIKIINLVSRYCPHLQRLTVDDQINTTEWDSLSRKTTKETYDRPDMKTGLSSLRMVVDHVTLSNLNPYLQHAQSTLQELQLILSPVSRIESHLASPRFKNWKLQVPLENLTKLYCSGQSLVEQQHFITNILRASQHVEHVAIHFSSETLIPELISVLSTLTKLKCLEIDGEIDTCLEDVNAAFLSFLDKHISEGHESSLRTLIMESVTLTSPILEKIAQFKMLQELSLISIDYTAFYNDIHEFAETLSLSTTTTLRTLSLEMCDAITDTLLEALSAVSTLKNIYFYKLEGITTSGVQNLIDKSGSVSYICITKCPMVEATDSLMYTARTKRIKAEVNPPWTFDYYPKFDRSFCPCDTYNQDPSFTDTDSENFEEWFFD